MPAEKFPFAVRLVGFAPDQARALAALLAGAPAGAPGYFCLSEHSLQEPDLLIANGDALSALAALSTLASGQLRPALIIGEPSLALPYSQSAAPRASRWPACGTDPAGGAPAPTRWRSWPLRGYRHCRNGACASDWTSI